MRNKIAFLLLLLTSVCSKVLSTDVDVPILWPSGSVVSSKLCCAMFEATLPHIVNAINSQPNKTPLASKNVGTWTLYNISRSQPSDINACFAMDPNMFITGLTNFVTINQEMLSSLRRTGHMIKDLVGGTVSTHSLKTVLRLTDVIADPPPPVGLAFSVCVHMPTQHIGNESYVVAQILARYTLVFSVFTPGTNILAMDNQIYISGLATVGNSALHTNFSNKVPESIDQ